VTDCETMSQEAFDADEPAIRDLVKAIMSNAKIRKSCRIFELHEMHTGELLAELFDTSYGPVIAHRSHGSADRLRVFVVPGPVPDPALRGRGKRELVIAPLTNDPDQRFPIMARNLQYRLPVKNLRQWIAEDKTQHAISYRGAAQR
jgi:hypothetical protein